MIGRADIEGSKSNVAMNAWLPQASSFILIISDRDKLVPQVLEEHLYLTERLSVSVH